MECFKGQERWINLLIGLQSRGTIIVSYTDKKEKQIFLIYKEIYNGVVAKKFMTKSIFAHFLMY